MYILKIPRFVKITLLIYISMNALKNYHQGYYFMAKEEYLNFLKIANILKIFKIKILLRKPILKLFSQRRLKFLNN